MSNDKKVNLPAGIKRFWTTAVITRADGTVEELGVISDSEEGTAQIVDSAVFQEQMRRVQQNNQDKTNSSDEGNQS